jgi:hypothetical protein
MVPICDFRSLYLPPYHLIYDVFYFTHYCSLYILHYYQPHYYLLCQLQYPCDYDDINHNFHPVSSS